jgi:WhiB family redox-sensing transcriptional regulator
MTTQPLPVDDAWMVRASCINVPQEEAEWFPTERTPLRLKQKAINICLMCPVRTDCLEYALRHKIKYGIWGGANEQRRERMRRASG